MQTTYLSMGSNIGDRQYYLHEAIRLLGKHPKIMIEKVSNFYGKFSSWWRQTR